MKEYTEYEFYRDEDGNLKARPKKPILSDEEEKELAVKEYEKAKRNEKVDARREKLAKFGKKIGGGLKKTGKYLSETKLAEQSHENHNKSSGRYKFEEKNDWI